MALRRRALLATRGVSARWGPTNRCDLLIAVLHFNLVLRQRLRGIVREVLATWPASNKQSGGVRFGFSRLRLV